MTDIQRRWDLWHLKTLFPRWGETELEALLRVGAAHDQRQQELFGDPRRAYRRFETPARDVITNHPDLGTGLTLSLHLGPYSLAPVPWLIAGHDVHLLVNRSSLAEIRPVYDTLQTLLELPGQIIWVPIEGQGFVLRLLKALRRRQPVFAFVDGNDGLAGCEGTLEQGIVHSLPGRDIRVRTGLARLALMLRCPVHTLVTVWNDNGGFDWQRGPTWQWPRGTSAPQATRTVFTWAFDQIAAHPAQWRAWNMLTGVCDSFRDSASEMAPEFNDMWEVSAVEHRHRLLKWRRPATVWPGGMLEDVAGNCFYDSGGILPKDLQLLQDSDSFSPAEVGQRLGDCWIDVHLPRLVALGFIGPIDGLPVVPTPNDPNPG